MKKLLVIVGKELTVAFTAPIVLVLGIVVPLALAVLIKLAFGNLVLGRGIPEASIPVGIVNQDRGGSWGDFGEIWVRALTADPETATLRDDLRLGLFKVREIEEVAQARRMVETEALVAMLYVPPDFSEALATERATVEVTIHDRYGFRGEAFKSAIETYANLISTSEVAVRTAVTGLAQDRRMRVRLQTRLLDEAVADLALAAVKPEANPIQVQREAPVEGSAQLELTHYLAATVAIMFAGLWNLIGCALLLQEKAQGTLQRMVVTPTRLATILAGKVLSVYLGSLIQMVALVGGMAVMEWILSGDTDPGPKVDLLGLFLLIQAMLLAAAGVGVAVAGLAGSYTQAEKYGRALLLVMGLAGGVFFPVDLFPWPWQALSRLTYHYWAMDGYLNLALGGSARSILPHVFILTVMGLLLLGIGGRLLRRRMEPGR